MLKLIKSNLLIISASVISLCFSLFLISPVLATIPKTPPNTVNMMVGHYFEDYYEYITFVKEGQNGHFILSNLFSSDDPSRYIAVWWPYALMGFVTYLLKIPIPVQIVFWLSSAVFSFVLFMLVYVTICRLLPRGRASTKLFAFLFFLFSGDFFTVSLSPTLILTPINYWYAIGSPFSRFSNVTPHHQLTQIIFLAGLLFASRENKNLNFIKETVVLFVISLLLLSLSPPHLILFWLAIFTTKLICTLFITVGDSSRGAFFPFLFSFLLTLPIAFFLNQSISSSPSLLAGKIWDTSHYYYPSLTIFAQNTGLLLILAILGLPFYFSRQSLSRVLFFTLGIFSFLLTLTPQFKPFLSLVGVHNLRFQTAFSYFFLAVSSVILIAKIFKENLVRYFVSTAIVAFFLLSLYANWLIMLKVPYGAGNLQYVPWATYQGIKTLEKTNDDRIVLTTPSSLQGLLVTAVAGKKVYLGRSIFTLHLSEKAEKASSFYSLKMTESEAKTFLEKEHIGYILLSPWEQDPQKILAKYGFLKIIFQNDHLTIFGITSSIAITGLL